METKNNPHHSSDLKLLFIVFLSVGAIFIALTVLSFTFLKNISGDSWWRDLTTKIELFIKALEEDSATIETTTFKPTSTTTETNSNVQINNVKPSPTPQPTPYCYRYKINDVEFRSDKCYNFEDYSNLSSYISRYNSAVNSKNSAEATMEITCDDSEFFEQSCNNSKTQKENAEEDMEYYKQLILEIIKKGI